MQRYEDWPERLDAFLHSTASARFEWGINDCAIRVCDAIAVMTGVDPAEPFRGRYTTARGAARVIHRYAGTLEELAERIASYHGLEEVPVLMAQRGDVVLMDLDNGPALGVVSMNGHEAEFIGPDGVVRPSVSECRRAWRVG